jgi:hypothetical protein
MISAYNTRQVLLAILNLLLSAFCYFLTFLFFYWAAGFLIGAFGPKSLFPWRAVFAGGALLLVTGSGWWQWRKGEGLYGFHESGMFINAEPTTGVGFLAQRDINRVVGPAYMLGQVALAAPLQLLRAYGRFRGLIPPGPELERGLETVLGTIKARNKWEGPEDYPGQEREVFLLNRMGLIDFSPTKMKFRAKS